MSSTLETIKKLIEPSFQIITVGILVFLSILVLKQQKDIKDLESQIDSTEYRLESKIESAESTLSSDIEDVRRAVIVWSD
jgi:hypothetical protein